MLEKNLDLWALSVRVGAVFKFRGEKPFPANREVGHHFIVVGVDEKRQQLYYVVNGSSKVSRWKANIHRTLGAFPGVRPEDTYVVIPGGQTPYFPRETMVNCNAVHSLSLEDLKRGEFEMVSPSYLDESNLRFLFQILRAVVASPQVSERAKRDARGLVGED
ncbi:hypothetical protein [Rothia nasimurium]|uniref:hypothetical protein n=1 Tax=Rothia nasimurium TaxID=85336 RepID=UPI001F3FBC58|nr:hypothetical protein [Rothia nasimurium]